MLGFQLLGEALVVLLGLPLPGPVIGLVALFVAFPRLGRLRSGVESLADGLLRHLGLLFVPAGVGVMLHLALLRDWALPLVLALVGSTAVTLGLSAWLFARWRRPGAPAQPPSGGAGPP
ncbi:antiholin-like protein LrgA [Piscinibacter sakaiensis]|uniref:Antiholin-like protein LrgA n=1 Tax=Piscinibacter sakaiensis TaxID=1547922 RepID=A0A0K8NWS7_PISS1|nr:antiholin-like protein LrgA [Piscinibacter sakaiensis]